MRLEKFNSNSAHPIIGEHKYRYSAIARLLATQVANGLYAAGDKLPSVRALMAEHGISSTTAARVLVELETNGLAEARPRSGFYVSANRVGRSENVPAGTRTAERAAKANVDGLIAKIFKAANGIENFRRILPLGAAELDETLLPHKELSTALSWAVRESGAGIFAYGHRSGELVLRRRIAHLLAAREVTAAPGDIIVTAGASEAMGMALRAVTKRGDTIAVESPCFFGFLQWIETLGLKAMEIATDPHEGIDLDELERVAGRGSLAALALNPTFHNPFGFSMPPERMQKLAGLAVKLQLPIVEDDTYGELHYGRNSRRPLKSFDTDGWVLYCSSFSKTLAPGFRIGWCVPGRFGDAFETARMPQNVGTGKLAQLALARYLDGRSYYRHLKTLRSLFERQMPTVRDLVLKTFPLGTRVSEPRGGFVFWVEVPAPFDVFDFHRVASGDGISIAPGPIFSASGRFRNAFRLSVGRRLTPDVVAGIRRLGVIAADQR